MYFLCALFLSPCVCLKTQNATPKCTQPNPSAPKVSLILLHALDLPLFACETSKFDNSPLFVNCDSLNLVWKIIIFWINLTEIGENWLKTRNFAHRSRRGCPKSPARNQHSFGFVFLFVCLVFLVASTGIGRGDRTHLNMFWVLFAWFLPWLLFLSSLRSLDISRFLFAGFAFYMIFFCFGTSSL